MASCLWRGPKGVLGNFHEVVGLAEQLCVNRESTVQLVSWLCAKAQRELALHHKHGAPEGEEVEEVRGRGRCQ